MHTFKSIYGIGQTVYLVTDIEQRERMVTGVEFAASGAVLYILSCCLDTSRHYEMEISAEVNQEYRLGIEISRN